MNVNPSRAHDSHAITISQVPRDGKTGAAGGGLAHVQPGAQRDQLAMVVSERLDVMKQLQNNANSQREIHRDLGRLTRQAALADRVVRILPNVLLGAAGCFVAGAVSGLGSGIALGLAHHFESDEGYAVAGGMAMAGAAMMGVSLTGALCAMGAARLSARQWAQIQTERDHLWGIAVELQGETNALEARDLDLEQAQDEPVRYLTRHYVEQETDMPMVLVKLVVDYLADEDLPRPSLPAPTGS